MPVAAFVPSKPDIFCSDPTHCQVIPSPNAKPVAPDLLKGVRPPQCENPVFAHQQALGECVVKLEGMSHCGCPEFNNPIVKESFRNRAIQMVQNLLIGSPQEMTLTFVHSGHLLNDCQLLNQLFAVMQEQRWQGELYLQFLDPYYGEHLKPTEDHYKRIAGVVALVAVVFFVWGITQKNHREAWCIPSGIVATISTVLSLYLFLQPQSNQFHQLSPSQQAFLTRAATLSPFKLNVSFSPHLPNRASHAIFAYDIGKHLEDVQGRLFFETLKTQNLTETGNMLIAITDQQNRPFLVTAAQRDQAFSASLIKLG